MAGKAPRFGIGEWYGRSFVGLSDTERLEFARYKANASARLKAAERSRLALLAGKKAAGEPLTNKEADRLDALLTKQEAESASNKPCPFKSLSKKAICTKEGGVCSLRMFEQHGSTAIPVNGPESALRVVCPSRFHEDRIVFKEVGKRLLSNEAAVLVPEVGFLSAETAAEETEDEKDVGKIDMILIRSDLPPDYPMQWAALEIQAVYFSGKKMASDFKAIEQAGGKIVFPVENRRPDYRSSAPKRLMPQLQIKVPTLRRWGKKMAVAIDRSFFNSLGRIEFVDAPSNADIAWVIVDFVERADGKAFTLEVGDVHFATLERAIEGLTGGKPVSMEVFEQRIRTNLPVAAGLVPGSEPGKP